MILLDLDMQWRQTYQGLIGSTLYTLWAIIVPLLQAFKNIMRRRFLFHYYFGGVENKNILTLCSAFAIGAKSGAKRKKINLIYFNSRYHPMLYEVLAADMT